MLVRPTPLVIPPRASATIQIVNSRFALTKQQISEIAHIFDPAAKDELAKARTAWIKYQSTRKRDAIYGFLSAVFEIVSRWKKQNRAKASSRRALSATKRNGAIRTNEPFAVVVFCTSDPDRVDAKTRSKWSRVLRYAERFKPDNQGLTQFIKSRGGINECAARWSGRLRPRRTIETA